MYWFVWVILACALILTVLSYFVYKRYTALRKIYVERVLNECAVYRTTGVNLRSTAMHAFECRRSIREQERGRLFWIERAVLNFRDWIVYRGPVTWERILQVHKGRTEDETYQSIIRSSQHPEHLNFAM